MQRQKPLNIETLEPLIVLSASTGCSTVIAECVAALCGEDPSGCDTNRNGCEPPPPSCGAKATTACEPSPLPSSCVAPPTEAVAPPANVFSPLEGGSCATPPERIEPTGCAVTPVVVESPCAVSHEAPYNGPMNATPDNGKHHDVSECEAPRPYMQMVSYGQPNVSDSATKPEGPTASEGQTDRGDASEEPLHGNDQADDHRDYSGLGNNIANPEFGTAGATLLRLSEADDTRLDDAQLPSAREVSNIVNAADKDIENDRGLSDFLWAFGQFLDHDLTLTAVGSGDSANIEVPKGDPFFDPAGTGTAEIGFERSDFFIDANGDRQNANSITAFVDASQVYGSDDQLASALRTNQGGLMKLSDGNLMPLVETEPDGTSRIEFLAGDVRAGENVALSSMHTLFLREHNRLATMIAETEYHDADLSSAEVDEAIYQKARTLVAAELQHITYNEFLPALLGGDAIDAYQGYDPRVNPGISTEFSTAAFRVGHTMLSPLVLRLDEFGEPIPEGNLALQDAFNTPETLIQTGIDPLLRGLAAQSAQEIDTYIVDDVRNFLFGPPGAGGFDLASLNIQRGRDHEIPAYNDVREAMGLERFTSFDQISDDPEVVNRLKTAYTSVDDIDLWVGGLAEEHSSGSNVGETFTAIIADQFTRLRDGDRFWYENALPAHELGYVKSLNLSDIIRMNTGIELQDNVFFVKQPTDYLA